MIKSRLGCAIALMIFAHASYLGLTDFFIRGYLLSYLAI
jgi:hypothetical protein